MRHLNDDKKLREAIGVKLKEFREKVMASYEMTLKEFSDTFNIPVNKLKSYEDGGLFPEYRDLATIASHSGLNLNWLIYGNGSMFFCREKDMEEIIREIEENRTGRYEDYKYLLKLMRIKEFEDYFFSVFNEVVTYLARLARGLLEKPEFKDLVSKSIEKLENNTNKLILKNIVK